MTCSSSTASISTHWRRLTACRSTCNISRIGQNIFKSLNRRAERSWDTVSDDSDNNLHELQSNPYILVMGKAEGHGDTWHGHVTALTVSPDYRRLGLAATLMKFLEDVSEKKRCFFVDLFVRVSNKIAINMYHHLGYIVYRTVLEYYSGDEDAYDMRRALKRDVEKKSMIAQRLPVRPEDID